eukprot:gene40168-53078_t
MELNQPALGNTTMKLGFQLKGSIKRKRISDHIVDDDTPKKDIILSIEGTNIVSIAPVNDSSKPLIIPLQQPINTIYKKNIIPQINDSTENKSIDDIAAAELLSELSGSGKVTTSFLTITNLESNTNQPGKYVPMLLANQPAELIGLSDDGERFKVDISLRPDEVDVRSDAYKSVPIEEFGAALLRGMGWEGPKEESNTNTTANNNPFDLMPREYRLGLGALPKPPDDK